LFENLNAKKQACVLTSQTRKDQWKIEISVIGERKKVLKETKIMGTVIPRSHEPNELVGRKFWH
jgi:hypothetical protein